MTIYTTSATTDIVEGSAGTRSLAELTLEVAKKLTNVAEGTATGGNATTVIDTAAWGPGTSVGEANDYWNNGTIWMRSGLSIGKSRIITDWASATWTWTFPTMTALNAAGDLYSVASKEYPRFLLIQGINAALVEIGGLALTAVLTTTVANQEAYSVAAYNDVRAVEIAGSLTSPYGYTPINDWYVKGTSLYFGQGNIPAVTGYNIRITYVAQPAELDDDTDTISDLIHQDLVVWPAVLYCLRWKMTRAAGNKPELQLNLAEAVAQAAIAKSKYLPAIALPRRKQARMSGL